MDFAYKKVLIWGYGISGHSVEKILIDKDIEYKILDESMKISGGNFISKISKKELLQFDLIVLSPAVDANRKELVFARVKGVDVISEIEFGYMFLSSRTKVIGVTGTNGKTTTTHLIYQLLLSQGYSVAEMGNIGKPLSDAYGLDYDYVVVELSSFQLQCVRSLRCNIAVILNVSPDHIDRHKTFANYLNAKLNILNNQTRKDYAIINGEDKHLQDIKRISASKIVFGNCAKSRYRLDGSALYKSDKQICDLHTYHIPPVLYQDIALLFTIADVLKIVSEDVVQLLPNLEFLPHRCEFVTKINNIEFYNDSKATNIHAVKACIDSLDRQQIMLMLGGKNKGLDFKDFIINMPAKVVKIIAFGACGKKIYKLRKYNPNIKFYCYKTLESAMKNITAIWDGVDTILLSPACASFDEFMSYSARGDFFKKYVATIRENYEENKD